jgi:hypothetical protein
MYTNHALNLNRKGKEVLVRRVVNVIKDILNVKKLIPIESNWKEEVVTSSIQSDNCEKVMVKNTPQMKGTKDIRHINN